MKKLRLTSKRTEAGALLVEVTSMLDKLAKRNVIHKNKAGNLVGKLTRHVNALK
jgi:small subunit ribosomal protein S20